MGNRGILMHFGLLFVLLKATKTYQKYSKTSPYRSNAQSGARGIYHIVVLQECSCFGTSTRNIPYPPENTKKTSKAHWCVICCPIQMAILGYSNEQMQAIYEQKRFFRPGMIETNESSQVLQITNMYRCS